METKNNPIESASAKTTKVAVENPTTAPKAKAEKKAAPKAAKAAPKAKEEPKAAPKAKEEPKAAPKAEKKAAPKVAAPKAKIEKPKVAAPKAKEEPKAAKAEKKAAPKAAKVVAPKAEPKAAPKAAKVVAPKAKEEPKARGRQAEGIFQEEIDYILARIRRAQAEGRMSKKEQAEFDAAKAQGKRVVPRYSTYYSAALLTSTIDALTAMGIEHERDCGGKGHRYRFFTPKKGTKAYKALFG